jgi:hypothetical protein
MLASNCGSFEFSSGRLNVRFVVDEVTMKHVFLCVFSVFLLEIYHHSTIQLYHYIILVDNMEEFQTKSGMDSISTR